MSETYYHGGVAGLNPGDLLVPSPPKVRCGCPVCAARAAGRSMSVGEYRRYLRTLGPKARPALDALEGAPDNEPVDPPSARDAVYLTTDREYAAYYASRSSGDLYRVAPVGIPEPSPEDHFDSYTVPSARVVEVLQRRVVLTRRERRALSRRWEKMDRRADRARAGVAS